MSKSTAPGHSTISLPRFWTQWLAWLRPHIPRACSVVDSEIGLLLSLSLASLSTVRNLICVWIFLSVQFWSHQTIMTSSLPLLLLSVDASWIPLPIPLSEDNLYGRGQWPSSPAVTISPPPPNYGFWMGRLLKWQLLYVITKVLCFLALALKINLYCPYS